jgi:hypothetical protein
MSTCVICEVNNLTSWKQTLTNEVNKTKHRTGSYTGTHTSTIALLNRSEQCGGVINVAMYSSVSPEVITKGQEQEVWRWVALETVSDLWRAVRGLGWWWICWCSLLGCMCKVLIGVGAWQRCQRCQRWLGCCDGIGQRRQSSMVQHGLTWSDIV